MEHLPFRYILSFGSNISPRYATQKQALLELAYFGEIIHQTRPLSSKALAHPQDASTANQSDYLNFIVDFASPYPPVAIYHFIFNLENHYGHPRTGFWPARNLDIDILYWAKNTHQLFFKCSQLSYHQMGLSIPHLELENRPFLQELLTQLPTRL